MDSVELSPFILQALIDFIESPDVQAVIDGANDPDPFVQCAKKAIDNFYKDDEFMESIDG